MISIRWIAVSFTGLLLVLAGCGGGGSDPAAPPSGWKASDTRMWKEGVDTSKVFREMGSLSEMGVLEKDFALSSGNITEEQFKKAIKQSLEELYRSNPTVVDSIFEEHAAPKLSDANLSGAVEDGQLKPKLLNEYQKKAYDAIEKYYRQPIQEKGVSDIPYPDSLRSEENSGRVEVQMHVNKDGRVDAVEVVEGTHPTLNAIIMKAGTQTTWTPGKVRQGPNEEWKSISGWGRVSTNFPAPR